VARFTLPSYASLCAELSLAPPEKVAEILRRYGVADETARRALDETWRARLAESPAMRQEMQKLYKDYRDWLLKQQPR
jgi:hypothetical protein